MRKDFLAVSLCLLILLTISCTFWQQEIRFLLPTPVPENYVPVKVQQSLVLHDYLVSDSLSKPVFLHFYNPDCACSTFNLDHFKRLLSDYQDKVDIYMVLQSEKEVEVKDFLKKYDLHLPVIVDYDEKIARLCGVYSTPQAVILDTNSRLYYRGNYNKTRYCTQPGSNYASIALDSLLARMPPPQLDKAATVAYGCQLPGDQQLSSFFFLNQTANER